MAGIVAQSYSDALFSLAQEEHNLDACKEQLCFVNDQMQENKAFFRVLTHPKIHKEEKRQALQNVFGSAIDHTLLNFLKLLIDKGRFQNIQEITREFVKHYNEVNDIVVAYVKSARKLQKGELKRLNTMLEKKLAKTVEMRCFVDPDLLAGIRIKINDMVLDNTALSRMDSLKQLAAATEHVKES